MVNGGAKHAPWQFSNSLHYVTDQITLRNNKQKTLTLAYC